MLLSRQITSWTLLLGLLVSFQNCGRIRLSETLSNSLSSIDRQTDVEFQDVLIAVDVNQSKKVNILSQPNQAKSVSLENSGSVNTKSFDGQGTVTLNPQAPGEVTYAPAYGFRGSLPLHIYVKYNDGRVQVVNLTFQVQNPLREFKPSLVVRAAACLLCHANIEGDLISDLGYKSVHDVAGPDVFFRGNSHDSNAMLAYAPSHVKSDPFNSGWTTATIKGKVIIPNVDLTNLPALPNGETRAVFPAPSYKDANGALKMVTSFFDYFDKVIFADKTRVSSIEVRSEIYIGAPTEDEIRTAGRLTSSNPLNFVKNDADKPGLSGFTHVTDNGKDFYTNTGDMVCDGDLFVDGVVFLKDLRLVTEYGCRIHTTKTVFINGAIEYLNEYALSNLEVMSSRAIYLGIGMCYDCYPGDTANVHFNENWVTGRAGNVPYWAGHLRATPDLSHYVDTIYADFHKVSNDTAIARAPSGTSDLKSYYSAKLAAAGITLVDVNSAFNNTAGTPFRRLLLNAPDVQSRYNGKFQGTVIAEFAVWKLGGQFSFVYDSVFTAVPIFPLLDLAKSISISK